MITSFFLFQGKRTDIIRLNPLLISGGNYDKTHKAGSEIIDILTEDIPDSTVFRVSGRSVVKINPERNWKAGLFFTFRVKSDKGKKIRTKISLIRKGARIHLKKVSGASYYHSFSKELKFRNDDIVEIVFSGNGYAAVNRPVFYRIIDPGKRTYVFVIALDTLRSDRTGKKMRGVRIMPNIDKFISDSVNFTNTFSQSNWTLPSFLSFFTSLYEFNHKATKESGLGPDVKLLSSDLSKNFFMYNLNSGLWMQGKYGFSTGFDFFNTYSNPQDNLGSQKLFEKGRNFLKNSNIPSLFMFLHTYQIHSPYNPPHKFIKNFKPEPEFKKLDTFFYKKQFKSDVSDKKRISMEELYNIEINTFDYYFGKFIDFLKERKIYGRSMIILMSDHGEEFYEHKGWSHGHSMFNEVISVPLFIKFPGMKYRKKIINSNCGLIDILPTICDFYGIETSNIIDGESLIPLLKDRTLKRDLLISSNSITRLVKDIPPKFSLIKGKYKMIFNYPYSKKNIEFFRKWGTPPRQKEITIFELDRGKEKRIEDIMFKKLFSEFRKSINPIKKIIEINSKLRSGKIIKLSEEEKKKLKSLGYFQK